MKLTELDQINKDPEFIESRLNFLKQLLIGLTLGGTIIIFLWQFFDRYYIFENTSRLVWLRAITAGIYFVNLGLAFSKKQLFSDKQHLVAGFYFGTIFCTLLCMFTGAILSPYWYGLFFILLAWFILMPFNYREMIIHGSIFVIMFIAGTYAYSTYEFIPNDFLKIIFLYFSTLLLGSLAALNKNKSEALNFKVTSALKMEVESHKQTARQLTEKQRFLDNILSNAPIVIWSIDLEGKFTYSQFKGDFALDPPARIGRSALEVHQGTEAEAFLRKVLNDEIRNDILNVNDIYYDTRVTPILDTNGVKTGYMGVSMDITQRIINEKALAKFKLVLDQAPAAVFIVRKDSSFEYINPMFTILSGYTREDLLNKDLTETLYKGTVPESRKEIINTIVSGNNWQGELLTIRKDGEQYWANTIAAPFKDESGNVDGYIVIQQDVTEQKKMFIKLKEREQLHQALIEDSLEGVVLAIDFNFYYVNKVFCEMTGFTFEELQKMQPIEVIAPEDRERLSEYHQMRMRGEKPPHTYQANFLRKDGSVFLAEMTTSSIEIGGKKASFISMRDITAKMKMEKALRESEEKYKTLIENATDGIVITQNGLLKFTNLAMCDMMGYTPEAMLDRSFYDFVVEEDHEVMIRYHQRRMKGEYFNALYRSRFIRKDGKIITVELNTRTSYYNNQPAAFIVIRDISERLNIEEELIKAKRQLEGMNKNLEARIKESSENLTEARTQLIRLQKENLQSQFEVLRQQVNPHFLFNSLNVLTSLIKLEPDLAEKFTEHLSKVYRYVLENKDNDLVSLKTELDFLHAYLFLLNIRFMDKIAVTINIEPEKTNLLILPLALQLLIENAIKHNTMSKKT
ncbi:MAG: PAS domain S-box protein, partial [Prolixibacteraceae bacterium]|nr:PAS domain S-box protein [Prolixibacteraceae bacterium]